MNQDIFILGATGNVGKRLLFQLHANEFDRDHYNYPTRIVGIASSKNYLYGGKGLDVEATSAFVPDKTRAGYDSLASLESLLDLTVGHHSSLVFVDVTAADSEMRKFHELVLDESPFSIVTANKLPLANSSFEGFVELTRQVERYGYRSSVMAGNEAVPFIRDLNDLGDPPITIQGCFSGTLGYLCSKLEEGMLFSEALKEAKASGYTEPDPRDDLSGMDVARKLLILARTGGYNVTIGENLHVDPFAPENFLMGDTVEAFMASIDQADEYFSDIIAAASSRDNTLRYVAEFEARGGRIIHAGAGLKEVPIKGPLGSLHGTANKIVVTSQTYLPASPYIVQAPGAGLVVTAQNVRRDLLYMLNGREQLN
ncbi:MAG: hypothetical protein AABX51_04990 [Nanoarchaeota archaeon]